MQATARIVAQLVNRNDHTMLRLALGRLLLSIDEQFGEVSQHSDPEPLEPRMHLWSGHDTTILPVRSAWATSNVANVRQVTIAVCAHRVRCCIALAPCWDSLTLPRVLWAQSAHKNARLRGHMIAMAQSWQRSVASSKPSCNIPLWNTCMTTTGGCIRSYEYTVLQRGASLVYTVQPRDALCAVVCT
jgi:hypothetical protein